VSQPKKIPDFKKENLKVNILQQPWLVSLGVLEEKNSSVWSHQVIFQHLFYRPDQLITDMNYSVEEVLSQTNMS